MSDVVDLVLSHESALAYWSIPEVRMPATYLSVPDSKRVLASAVGAIGSKELAALAKERALARLPRPLDVLVSNESAHRASSVQRVRTLYGEAPEGSLARTQFPPLELEGGPVIRLNVTSPELTFIQMGALMTEAELTLLGLELCGGYSMAPAAHNGFVSHCPVTSASSLQGYCRLARGLHGITQARSAARYVLDNSKSPRESNLSLLLTLPRQKGGLMVEKPLLNHSIALPRQLARILGYDSISPDFFWPNPSVGLEYNSRMYHSTAEKNEDDSRRNNTYRIAGIDTYSLTPGQFRDFEAMRQVLWAVARAVDPRHTPQSEEDIAAMRELHHTLMQPPRLARFADPWQITYR